jgi:asparagine synthetase B (glutamine-hydrolysing)
MCGIAGVIGPKNTPFIVQDMVAKMKRRGPDSNGYWQNNDQSYCIGHTRLAIIDLSNDGAQPTHIRYKELSIVFNTINKSKLTFSQPVNRFAEYEVKNYLLNTLLRDSDALSMAGSLELRPIFLDHKIVEFSFLIGANLKLRNDLTKSVLKDATKDLLPPDFFDKKEKGFIIPLFNWLNGSIRPQIIECFQSDCALQFFNPKYLKVLVDNVGSRSYTAKIWTVFVFLSWAKEYNLKADR